MAAGRVYSISLSVSVSSTPQSKMDMLLSSLSGSGSVSDRLYAKEKTAYAGPLTGPLSMNDYIVGNGHAKKQIN